MKTITIKAMKNYFKENGFEVRHNLKAFKKAINLLNKEVKTDALDLFYLIVENKSIPSLYTHSYGFHTANGRHLINTFKNLYHANL